jgi:hypothetical protein
VANKIIFTPENRLAKVLLNVDAPMAHQLIQQADVRVAQLTDAVREQVICKLRKEHDVGKLEKEYVAAKLRAILDLAGVTEEDLLAECQAIGQAATEIAEVAGAAGMATIGEIARGVAAMVENQIKRGTWHGEALRLHINTLSLMGQGDSETPEADAKLADELRVLRKAIGVVE